MMSQSIFGRSTSASLARLASTATFDGVVAVVFTAMTAVRNSATPTVASILIAIWAVAAIGSQNRLADGHR